MRMHAIAILRTKQILEHQNIRLRHKTLCSYRYVIEFRHHRKDTHSILRNWRLIQNLEVHMNLHRIR